MHSIDTAQSLLALPAEVTQPSPYMVFGLTAGESDTAAISQAIKTTIARLNAVKPTADPVAWQQAAGWVKRARGVLLDPALKSRLDRAPLQPADHAATARRSVTATPLPRAVSEPRSVSAEVAPAADQADRDPLLGLLPGGARADSPAPAPVPVTFRAGPGRALPPPKPPSGGAYPGAVAATAPVSEPPSIDPFGIDPPLPPSLAAQLAAAPPKPAPSEPTVDGVPLPIRIAKADDGVKRRRRRHFPWAAVSLGLFSLISVGGIAALMYVLNRNPGGIVINLQAVAADSGGERAAADSQPPVRTPRPLADPVMGGLAPAPARSSRRSRDDAQQLAAADDWFASLAEREDDSMASPPGMPLSRGAAPPPRTSMPVSMPESEPAIETMRPVVPGEASGAGGVPPVRDAEAAQQAIDKARQAVASADWQTMQSLAETAQQAAVTADQKKRASRLFQLAELASYYHGGVERGLDGLEAGESFAVTEKIQVVMVEIGKDEVIVKFSGRNKPYPRRELPLVLAHKIATFAMPAGAPETTAAAHAYQAVAPISTPAYRQQAIRALEAMTEEVEGADPVDVAAAIGDVFGE